MEPNEQAPERIQVFGVFSIARKSSAQDFSAPASGYLYYRLPTKDDSVTPDLDRQTTLNEWKDLKSVAGTNQIVAFGGQWVGVPAVHKADARPDSPDRYTLNVGIRKINADSATFPPIRALRDFKPGG